MSGLLGTELDALAQLPLADAIAQVAEVRRRLPACDDAQVLGALAAALPRRFAALGALAPELALALAELAEGLAPHGAAPPTDLRSDASLEPRVELAWLRAMLLADPAAVDRLDEPTLLRVLGGWALEQVPDALPILARAAGAADARLRLLAVRAAPAAIEQLAVAPRQVFDLAVALARDDADDAVRAAALALACARWLVPPELQIQRVRSQLIDAALDSADRGVSAMAIRAAAEHGLRDLLLARLPPEAEAVEDERAARIVEVLGALAQPDDLDVVLALVPRDPLRFGPAARRFLLDAHRRGAFVQPPHVPAVLALYDQHLDWTAEELVRVTHVARARLIELLGELPDDDPRWSRRASLLCASFGAGAGALASAVLRRLAPATVDGGVATGLLDAAARSAEFFDEEALLAYLPRFPESVLPALRAKGGVGSLAPLRAIVEDPMAAPSLRAAALDVLWALEPDRPALLAELARHLPPTLLALTGDRFVSSRDGAVARALLSAPHAEREPLAVLRVLCESGQVWALPEVTRRFREVLTGYVRKALAGDFAIKRTLVPELEQLVFRLGRHLVKDGRPVRRWVADGPETGRDLLLRLVVDWLGEEPEGPIRVALLEIAARHAPDGAYLRMLEPNWRRGGVEVRRAAVELLAAVPAGAAGLELSLGQLVADADDARLLAQALAAVTALRAAWTEPAITQALARPEMLVKKAAAEALAELATVASAQALLDWIAVHDNDSFRAPLLRALRRAAGPAYVAMIVDRLERLDGGGEQARSRKLLHGALSGQVSLRAVCQLARRDGPVHRELVDAAVAGTVGVASCTVEQVAAALHRARLRIERPSSDPLRRLRVEGFSVEAAAEALRELAALRGAAAERQARLAALQELVRGALPSWVSWLRDAADPLPDALELVFAAAEPGELAPTVLGLAEAWHARVSAEVVASAIERGWGQGGAAGERARAVALVRALAPSAKLGGLRRYRLLGKLGAVRTASDLHAAMEETRLGPSVATESFELAREALAIPAAERDEAAAITALRDEAAAWFRKPAAERAQWLARVAKERPLDIAPLPAPPRARGRAAPPSSAEALAELTAALDHERGDERQRAASAILAWPDAHRAWPLVARCYVDGAVELTAAEQQKIAAHVGWDELPGETARAARVLALVPHLPAWRRRALAERWLERWEAGASELTAPLAGLGAQHLLPLVAARVRAGRVAAIELLAPRQVPAELLAELERVAPSEAARLWRARPPAAAPEEPGPLDPLAEASRDELERLARDRATEKGLAVRAVHALASLDEPSVDVLSRLATDRRPTVRSAALRALRTVASREHTLAVTCQVLDLENRRDVVLSLLSSLGHGRYPPALPLLLERVIDRDPRIARAAADALRAWGRDAAEAVRRAARHARPDRRKVYEALLAELG